MLGTQQKAWIAVDIGGRWIKCARYVVRRGRVHEVGRRVIDIQAEGLLSPGEVAAAVERVLRAAGEHPLAVVLPQSAAVSQVVDLPEFTAGDRSAELEEEVLELTGLSAERCVYDNKPLAPGGGFSGPQWVTVAKEEDLIRYVSPLLGQGLQIEAATTGGNALVAAFRELHPEIQDANLVDLGATQTTLVRIEGGEPVQMTSLITGGEAWTEALSKSSGEDFEELEARLFGDDLFAEPSLGPVLRDAVEAWQQQVVQQFGEWQDELSTPEQAGRTKEPFFLFGGYSAVRGLREALEQAEGLWHFPRQSDPIGLSGYGAVLMATGLSDLRASVLPRSLVKVRDRRRNLARLKEAVLYAFFIVAIVLGFGLFKQSARLDQFATANREANATLAEMKAAAKLLEQRDALRARIEPVVDAQLNSRDSLETFRKIQAVREAIDFTLIRFVDRQTYFQGMDEEAQVANSGNRVEPNPNPPNRRSSGRLQAFVVELTVPGGQAERLQLLGEIVGRLREEPHFANVDRLLNRASAANGMGFTGEDESYALLLTLAGEHSLRPFNKKEGAGR